jgi:hypothetical protein
VANDTVHRTRAAVSVKLGGGRRAAPGGDLVVRLQRGSPSGASPAGGNKRAVKKYYSPEDVARWAAGRAESVAVHRQTLAGTP